jgi:di/tricarboxylate transporter
MSDYQTLILIYILFIWLVLLHTFEEIAHGAFDLQIGFIQMTRQKYLKAASLITTINLATFIFLFLQEPIGYYLGLFSSAIIGVFQAIVHGVGFLKDKNTRGMGVGFYSSIPLAICGIVLLIKILQQMING